MREGGSIDDRRGNVRPRVNHPGRVGRIGEGESNRLSGTTSYESGEADGGAISPSLAEAWKRARMERDNQPSAARRVQLDLALVTGWTLADIASLRLNEVTYVMSRLERRHRGTR